MHTLAILWYLLTTKIIIITIMALISVTLLGAFVLKTILVNILCNRFWTFILQNNCPKQIKLFLRECYPLTALVSLSALHHFVTQMTDEQTSSFFDIFNNKLKVAQSLCSLNLLEAPLVQLQGVNAELKGTTSAGIKAGENDFVSLPILRFSQPNQRIKLLTFETQEGCISVPSGCLSRVNVKRRERPSSTCCKYCRNPENTQ